MLPNFASHPIVWCLLLIMSSFAQVVIGNGSCQMYGHSCLGGHGKRSSNSELDTLNQNSPPNNFNTNNNNNQRTGDSESEEAKIIPEIELLASEIESQLSVPRTNEVYKNNLNQQFQRIQQYRKLKRLESLLNFLVAKKSQKFAYVTPEFKQMSQEIPNFELYVK